jgi:hypothetical protein
LKKEVREKTRGREKETQLIKKKDRNGKEFAIIQLRNCAKRPEGGKQKGRGGPKIRL